MREYAYPFTMTVSRDPRLLRYPVATVIRRVVRKESLEDHMELLFITIKCTYVILVTIVFKCLTWT